jgi:hypothetical protein
VKAEIVKPEDVDIKAIFRGSATKPNEDDSHGPSRSKNARGSTVQPNSVDQPLDTDDAASQSTLVAKYYDPTERCPDGMDPGHWSLPPNYSFPKIVKDYNVAYVRENFPALPIWHRKEGESPRDCVDRQFRLMVNCLIRALTSPFTDHISLISTKDLANKSTKPESRLWSSFPDILSQNQLCLAGYSMRARGVPGLDFHSKDFKKFITEPGQVDMLEGLAGLRSWVGGNLRVEEWTDGERVASFLLLLELIYTP